MNNNLKLKEKRISLVTEGEVDLYVCCIQGYIFIFDIEILTFIKYLNG